MGFPIIQICGLAVSFLLAKRKVMPVGKVSVKNDDKALSEKQEAWIAKIVNETQGVLSEGEMPLSVAYGQACVETGYGSAGVSNPWGKRGSGDKGSQKITTTEYINGKKVIQTGQKFANYSSNAAAASGYVDFLSGTRYKKGWPLRSEPGFWLLWLWGVGYASGPNYFNACVDASRHVAKVTGVAELEIYVTDEMRNVNQQLKSVTFEERRALTEKLLDKKLSSAW